MLKDKIEKNDKMIYNLNKILLFPIFIQYNFNKHLSVYIKINNIN